MPSIHVFPSGLVVYMYCENGSKHNQPHVHCRMSGQEAVIDFSGKVLAGSITATELRSLRSWIIKSREKLEQNWQLLLIGEKPNKI